MVAAQALMPIHNLLPVAAGMDNRLGTNPSYIPERYREPVAFKVYSPDETSGVYGSDGEEITIQRTGRLIDLYV